MARFNDEKELINGLRARDQRAWGEFVKRYSRLLYATARHWLGRFFPSPPEEDVNNIYQQMFAHLLEHNCRRLATFQGKSSFGTWLSVVAGRVALQYVRNETKKGRFSDVPLDPAGRFAFPAPRELELEAKELREMFESALAELRPVEQLALRLFYFRDFDHDEIAATLGISPNSVSPTLTRAREKLRDALERKGYKLEDFFYQ